MSAPVCLRAAGGPSIGIGHLMRTRAVAHALEDAGVPYRFLVDDAPCVSWLARRGIAAEAVDESESWATDDSRGAWLDGFRPWDAALERLDARGTPVTLAENRTSARERCAHLVYPALHWRPDAWDRANAERGRGGPEWIPLAREVLATEPAGERDVDLLVTFGGSDPAGLTERTLGALAALSFGGRTLVTCGPNMEARRDEIARRARRLKSAELVPGAHGIVTWMARARRAVTAVQTTLYELAYLGVPALVLANYASDAEALGFYAEHGPHAPLGIAGELDDEELAGRIGARLGRAEGPGSARRRECGGGARRIGALVAGIGR